MDNITRVLIRFLKETNYYNVVTRNLPECNKFLLTYINTINIYEYIVSLNNNTIYDPLYDFKKIFDNYSFNEYLRTKKQIVVYNVKNYNKFSKFLNENGIIWASNTLFSYKDSETFSKYKNSYFLITSNSQFRLFYGKYYTDITSLDGYNEKIVLEEEDFYEYFLNLRKEVNEKILSFFKKDKFKII